MLGIDSNERIHEYVKKYIDVPKYSYHQINIKHFISQWRKFKVQLLFSEKGEDVTEKCIEEFVKYTKYFTNGRFAKLLTETKKIDKKII